MLPCCHAADCRIFVIDALNLFQQLQPPQTAYSLLSYNLMHSKKYFVSTVQLTILHTAKSPDDSRKKNLNISSSENTIISLIQFYKPANPSENAKDYILAEIYLPIQSESLFIKLRKQDMNYQICWDQKTLEKIEHQFGNTNPNRISYQYDIEANLLNCYISMQQHLYDQPAYTSQLKVLLFTKKPINLYNNSFQQMKLLFLRMQQQKLHTYTYRQIQSKYFCIFLMIKQIGRIQSEIQRLISEKINLFGKLENYDRLKLISNTLLKRISNLEYSHVKGQLQRTRTRILPLCHEPDRSSMKIDEQPREEQLISIFKDEHTSISAKFYEQFLGLQKYFLNPEEFTEDSHSTLTEEYFYKLNHVKQNLLKVLEYSRNNPINIQNDCTLQLQNWCFRGVVIIQVIIFAFSLKRPKKNPEVYASDQKIQILLHKIEHLAKEALQKIDKSHFSKLESTQGMLEKIFSFLQNQQYWVIQIGLKDNREKRKKKQFKESSYSIREKQRGDFYSQPTKKVKMERGEPQEEFEEKNISESAKIRNKLTQLIHKQKFIANENNILNVPYNAYPAICCNLLIEKIIRPDDQGLQTTSLLRQLKSINPSQCLQSNGAEYLKTKDQKWEQNLRRQFQEQLKIFDLDQGADIPFQSLQNRFLQAKLVNQKIAFCPSRSVTTQMFKSILQNRKSISIGLKGIAKSFSLILYWHLSNTIANNLLEQTKEEIQSLRKNGLVHFKIRKAIFLNYQRDIELDKLKQNILAQIPETIRQQISNKYHGTKQNIQNASISNLLFKIHSIYSEKNIVTRIFIDQINTMASFCRQYNENISKSNLQILVEYRKQMKYYKNYLLWKQIFTIDREAFYNSSANIQEELLMSPTNSLHISLQISHHSPVHMQKIDKGISKFDLFEFVDFELRRKFLFIGNNPQRAPKAIEKIPDWLSDDQIFVTSPLTVRKSIEELAIQDLQQINDVTKREQLIKKILKQQEKLINNINSHQKFINELVPKKQIVALSFIQQIRQLLTQGDDVSRLQQNTLEINFKLEEFGFVAQNNQKWHDANLFTLSPHQNKQDFWVVKFVVHSKLFLKITQSDEWKLNQIIEENKQAHKLLQKNINFLNKFLSQKGPSFGQCFEFIIMELLRKKPEHISFGDLGQKNTFGIESFIHFLKQTKQKDYLQMMKKKVDQSQKKFTDYCIGEPKVNDQGKDSQTSPCFDFMLLRRKQLTQQELQNISKEKGISRQKIKRYQVISVDLTIMAALSKKRNKAQDKFTQIENGYFTKPQEIHSWQHIIVCGNEQQQAKKNSKNSKNSKNPNNSKFTLKQLSMGKIKIKTQFGQFLLSKLQFMISIWEARKKLAETRTEENKISKK